MGRKVEQGKMKYLKISCCRVPSPRENIQHQNVSLHPKMYTLLSTVGLYPMSVQSVKKRNGCTLATAHKKIQHTLAGAEKSVKYRVWPGRNKAYFYNTICRETQNSPAKVFTKSAGLPVKRRPLRFFTPRQNTARKFSSCRSDKGYALPHSCSIGNNNWMA